MAAFVTRAPFPSIDTEGQLARSFTRPALWVAACLAGLVFASRVPDLPAAEVDAMLTDARSRFVTLQNGARVHVRDEGNVDGPTLVLVHGSYDSLHTWEPWVAELSAQFRLVSFDLPGHGLTGPVPDHDYSNAAFIRTLHGVVDALGLSQFALAGSSTGGAVAWEFALQHPGRVTQLVLLDVSGYPGSHPLPLKVRQLATQGFGRIFRLLPPRQFAKIFRFAAATPAAITDAALARTVLLMRREGSRDVIWKNVAEPDPDPTGRARAINVPTLILWGERDPFVPVEGAYAFHREIPQSQLIVYRNVGHLAMREIPKQSAADTGTFLRQATPVRGR